MGFAFATFLLIYTLFELLVRAQLGEFEAEKKVEAANYAGVLISRVDRELNSLLFISEGLTSYLSVYHNALDPKKIQAILADLYSRSKNVRNLAIAVGYRLTYVYPVKTNEKIIGVDFRALPKQWPRVKEAVEKHQGMLDGPLNLVQGGSGLVYRYPIYINDKYWGILSTVINTDPFFKSAFSGVDKKNYEVAIRVTSVSGQLNKAFYGNDNLFTYPKAFRIISDVPNAKWEWAIVRKTENMSRLILYMRLLGMGISILLGTVVYIFLRERKALTSQALYDSLTGLANRRLLMDRMSLALAQAKRFRRSMAIMFIDLDHFKKLNDTFGHDVGDELLKSVAQRLAVSTRDVDTLSRLGGDEFVLVLEEITNPINAIRVAENIISSFKEPLQVMGKSTQVNLSIGVAIFESNQETHQDDTVQSLMKKADTALYEVKAAGRNGYRVFTDSSNT